MANLGEKGKFRQKWRVCQKFIKGLAKYSNEITKRGILANGDFTKLTNLEKIYLRFDKRGMSILVGCKKMTYFAKPSNLTRIETMRQQNRHIDSWRFHKNGRFEKKGNWAELNKNPSTSWQNLKWGGKDGNIDKRRISTNMASAPKIHQGFGQIFKWDDKKGHVDSWRFLGQWQILQRWRIWQEVIKGLTKIYKEMTKRGILTNGDYNKNGKLGNISFKVCQNSNEMTNEACR